MEAMEEAISPHHIPSDDSSAAAAAVAKGKRTKRQRLQLSTSSPMLCGSLTEEEEDMANCLILLAKGRAADPTSPTTEPSQIMMEEAAGGAATVKFTSRRFSEAATTTNGRAGFYVYECKTCNKCFPSFQALGGHRASHKKPKLQSREAVIDEDSFLLSMNSFPTQAAAAAGGSNGKPRVHECSICGSEFSSGQALGGHMRRHRPASFPEPQEANQERSGLSLDLNLPAPADDDNRSCCELPKSPSASSATAFSFTSKARLLFSSSALVDCHY